MFINVKMYNSRIPHCDTCWCPEKTWRKSKRTHEMRTKIWDAANYLCRVNKNYGRHAQNFNYPVVVDAVDKKYNCSSFNEREDTYTRAVTIEDHITSCGSVESIDKSPPFCGMKLIREMTENATALALCVVASVPSTFHEHLRPPHNLICEFKKQQQMMNCLHFTTLDVKLLRHFMITFWVDLSISQVHRVVREVRSEYKSSATALEMRVSLLIDLFTWIFFSPFRSFTLSNENRSYFLLVKNLHI